MATSDRRDPPTFAHYLVLERLCSGGMSDVDLALQVVDEASFLRFAVIKRVRAELASDECYVRMFLDEARITSALHHQNISAVYDFGRVGDEYYLALEFVPGVDLRQVTDELHQRGQRVPLRVTLRILIDLLDALSHAHTRRDATGRLMGIVHRDVNPRNVMISIHGEVKLIDFGVAKATDRLENTRANHVKGKCGYMAPEQIGGDPVDARTDVYVAGLLLNELITGHPPCLLNPVQTLHRMVNGWVPELGPIEAFPEARRLRWAHDRAVAPRPGDRYPTAAEFAAELRAVADALDGPATDEEVAAFLAALLPDLGPELRRRMASHARAPDPADSEVTELRAVRRRRPSSRRSDAGRRALATALLTASLVGGIAGALMVEGVGLAALALFAAQATVEDGR